WMEARDLPEADGESFRSWFKKHLPHEHRPSSRLSTILDDYWHKRTFLSPVAHAASWFINGGKTPLKFGAISDWMEARDLPEADGESFRSWFKKHLA
ncbi:hypothetical protein ACUOFC_42310, partial [Escherichia sp. TWPC-MK]